jgi:ribosomal protein S18 acetylase RimI-like enzyme
MRDTALGTVDGKALRIRPARPEDLERLLWPGEHVRANRRAKLARQARGETIVLLPTLDGEPVGHLEVDLVRLRDEGGVYLSWFEVRDQYSGQGIGSAVLAQAERVAVAHARSCAEIEVAKTNTAARRLYERHGYEVVGERAGSWVADLPDGSQVDIVEDNWVLRKGLGGSARC